MEIIVYIRIDNQDLLIRRFFTLEQAKKEINLLLENEIRRQGRKKGKTHEE